VPRPLIFGARPLVCGTVIQLILAAGAPQRPPAEQALRGVDLRIQPVYMLVAQSNYSKEQPSGPQLVMLSSGIAQHLGKERCRMASQSQAELEKIIESDSQQEALYMEIRLQGAKPTVNLWTRWRDHVGKIAAFACDPATGERCVEYAVRDFPADISNHDEMCHRGKQCRVDDRLFIVPF
jgi:hypothetical protein